MISIFLHLKVYEAGNFFVILVYTNIFKQCDRQLYRAMANEPNTEDFRKSIQHHENKIRNFTAEIHRHEAYIEHLRHAPTEQNQEKILKEITRTQKGIAVFHEMINIEKDAIRTKIDEVTRG